MTLSVVHAKKDGEATRPVTYILSGGVMRLGITHEDLPLEDMLQMAERNNPRRAFLFVSTVLGRHIPVRPGAHREVLRRLAEKLVAPISEAAGPGLVMGYAETAVGLGAGVHDALLETCEREDMLYLPSTRHPGDAPSWFSFSEDHSHAQAHHVLRPRGAARDLAERARTIVLVDDEVTTGKTFVNLLSALMANAPREIEHVHLVTLTDWSAGQAANRVAEATGLPVERITAHSLIGGSWDWEPSPAFEVRSLPEGVEPLEVDGISPRFGGWRAGLSGGTPVDAHQLLGHIEHPGRPVLVIGTGENVWHPFRIAEDLEEMRLHVEFLATTRSPVREGGAIRRKASFADHYGLGLPMYLHNVDPARYGAIFLMIERDDAKGICPDLACYLDRFTAVAPDGTCIPFRDGVPCA